MENLLRRVNGIVFVILIPNTATAQNCIFGQFCGSPATDVLTRDAVMPPRTADGIATSAAANFERVLVVVRKKHLVLFLTIIQGAYQYA